jgi:hypothetical protein
VRYAAVLPSLVIVAAVSLDGQAPSDLRFDAATIKPVSEVNGRAPSGAIPMIRFQSPFGETSRPKAPVFPPPS